MNQDEFHVKDWFPDDLSDETAYALHGFLEQFTYRFEQAYYAQIRRYNQMEISHTGECGDDIDLPSDKIP